jgi:6-phospho-beta-glucosidase
VTRFAVLGGSAVSTPQLASALVEADFTSLHLALAGRSQQKLALVAEACRREAQGAFPVSAHTDVEEALAGADLILLQVRFGGLEGRAFDEQFPRELGIPGEETVGPGGFALAWRTLPALRALLETAREIAPQAVLLSLTNPASMVHRLASRYMQTITLCDAPLVLAQRVATLTTDKPREARPRYSGLNHCGWLTRLEIEGRDALPAALERAPELAKLTGVDADLIGAMGAVPTPYLRYLYHPERQLRAQEQRPRVRAQELAELETEALAAYSNPDADLSAVAARRAAPWYQEAVVPVARALRTRSPLETIVNLTNGGLLSFLPMEIAVEVAVDVVEGEVRPLEPDPLPADAVAILQAVAAFDLLACDSVLEGDRMGCVRALACHPLVPSIDVARELVDRVEGRFGPLEGSHP